MGAKFVRLEDMAANKAMPSNGGSTFYPLKPRSPVVSNRIRVPFFASNSDTPITSLWCVKSELGVTLQHDYDEFSPLGLEVEIDGERKKITGANGRNLTWE